MRYLILNDNFVINIDKISTVKVNDCRVEIDGDFSSDIVIRHANNDDAMINFKKIIDLIGK